MQTALQRWFFSGVFSCKMSLIDNTSQVLHQPSYTYLQFSWIKKMSLEIEVMIRSGKFSQEDFAMNYQPVPQITAKTSKFSFLNNR
ncbi:unnamed protein product [Larinioides sclopetarius]|uniref:Uncharacterized protein n=1 Tax=Larinioides sclopetarius TaxID=280406 RepID=A0AAV2AMZ1_9ARAC